MLETVKGYLKITWSDEDTDIQKIIDRGKARLNDLVGVEPDFDSAGLAQDLLLDYCRYAYNNAVEHFEDNFQKEILRLQLSTAAAELAAAELAAAEAEV
jgi:hypothetical protein